MSNTLTAGFIAVSSRNPRFQSLLAGCITEAMARSRTHEGTIRYDLQRLTEQLINICTSCHYYGDVTIEWLISSDQFGVALIFSHHLGTTIRDGGPPEIPQAREWAQAVELLYTALEAVATPKQEVTSLSATELLIRFAGIAIVLSMVLFGDGEWQQLLPEHQMGVLRSLSPALDLDKHSIDNELSNCVVHLRRMCAK